MWHIIGKSLEIRIYVYFDGLIWSYYVWDITNLIKKNLFPFWGIFSTLPNIDLEFSLVENLQKTKPHIYGLFTKVFHVNLPKKSASTQKIVLDLDKNQGEFQMEPD